MQNTSHAVMAQRAEAHDSLDFFPTPPWATRALCEYILPELVGSLANMACWEPACGIGSMARPLAEFFGRINASDIEDYSGIWGGQDRVVDFLWPGSETPHIAKSGVDWIITNPPFRLGERFARRALEASFVKNGVALLVRTAFLESIDRYRLYIDYPPAVVAQFAERVPMVKGRLDRKASTATAYAWIVWVRGETNTRFRWIPPLPESLGARRGLPRNRGDSMTVIPFRPRPSMPTPEAVRRSLDTAAKTIPSTREATPDEAAIIKKMIAEAMDAAELVWPEPGRKA